MSTLDDFLTLIERTEVIEQAVKSLKEKPVRLLHSICQEFERTGEPALDHRISIVGFIGEVSLKALLTAGMISQRPGNRLSLYRYQPTERGLEQCKNLKNSGFLK